MKKVRLSVRLFLSFGLISIFMMGIIGITIKSINDIRMKKECQVIATEINENVQVLKILTMEYYMDSSEESASQVEEHYNTTKQHMLEGIELFENSDDSEVVSKMNDEIEEYYTSFHNLKETVDINGQYSAEMAESIEKITNNLNNIILTQKEDYERFIEDTKNIKDGESIDIESLSNHMQNEYNEVHFSNEAGISNQLIMIAQQNYFLYDDVLYDTQVYKRLEELKDQCDWLSENFDNNLDRSAATFVKMHIDEFVEKYEAYKDIQNKQKIEKTEINEISLGITDATSQLAEKQELEMQKVMTKAITNSIIVGIISIILGLTLAYIISKNVSKRLNKNMKRLSDSAKLVLTASTQLAEAGRQLTVGSAGQAASLEETSATMDQTSSMANLNAQHTKKANILSDEARKSAEDGTYKIQGMSQSMNNLEKSSNEVSKIIKLIDDIAFQTNMLALNAAIEAARAGEAGLGFAVVAKEVRNLANKSAKAAKDTVEIIDRNIEISKQGILVGGDVKLSLAEIVEKTHNVNQIIGEISKASEEQSKGTAQVSIAISEMERVVQNNSVTAEQSAASAEELREQSVSLEKVVNELSRLVNGTNAKGNKKSKKFKISKMIKKLRKKTTHNISPSKKKKKKSKFKKRNNKLNKALNRLEKLNNKNKSLEKTNLND